MLLSDPPLKVLADVEDDLLDRAYRENLPLSETSVRSVCAELLNLRRALRAGQFAVLRASNAWTIADNSERANVDERETAKLVGENIDLTRETRAQKKLLRDVGIEAAGWKATVAALVVKVESDGGLGVSSLAQKLYDAVTGCLKKIHEGE